MSDTPDSQKDTERTKQVSAVCSTAGVSAFFALLCLFLSPNWSTALGVIAVMAMVTVVSFFILRR